MNTLLSLLNAFALGLIALGLIAAILSPRVHDGIIIKIGLIAMAAGFGAIALLMLEGFTTRDVQTLERALLMVNAGIAVVILGYLVRRVRARHPVRRSTDWAELRDTVPMKWPDEARS